MVISIIKVRMSAGDYAYDVVLEEGDNSKDSVAFSCIDEKAAQKFTHAIFEAVRKYTAEALVRGE